MEFFGPCFFVTILPVGNQDAFPGDITHVVPVPYDIYDEDLFTVRFMRKCWFRFSQNKYNEMLSFMGHSGK